MNRVWLLVGIAGCTRCEHSVDPHVGLECEAPGQAAAWDGTDPGGRPWRAVSFDAGAALVFGPVGEPGYADGLPIVVHAPGAYLAEAEPGTTGALPVEIGAVEVRTLYPGQSAGEVSAGGALDAGGAASAEAVALAIRFAAGELETTDGHALADVVGDTVCGPPAVLASSSGLAPALGALAETSALVAGLAAYESPVLPAFAAFDYGAVWFDPDGATDADGDGVLWDDGRDLDFDRNTCTSAGCAPPAEGWAWDPDHDLHTLMPALVGPEAASGLLFRDRDGDGLLSLNADGHPDADGSGAIDADEDWVPGALPGPDGALYYSPDVLAVAREALDPWPHGFGTLDESETFWADRSPLGRDVGALPLAALAFGEKDHASALPDRPHLVLLAEDWLEQGLDARLNGGRGVVSCLTGLGSTDWSGGDLYSDTDDLPSAALPEAVPRPTVAAAAALGLLWSRFGPFDTCVE